MTIPVGGLVVGPLYDYAGDVWRVEVREGDWDDYQVVEVIDVDSGEESDANSTADEIAEARGIARRP